MTYDDHLVWPIHVPRRCEPLITPHLSLWGNARTRATFPTHKKSHNPHPQGGGGEGGQDGYITLGGGGGGGACQTWIIYEMFQMSRKIILIWSDWHVKCFWIFMVPRFGHSLWMGVSCVSEMFQVVNVYLAVLVEISYTYFIALLFHWCLQVIRPQNYFSEFQAVKVGL